MSYHDQKRRRTGRRH